MSLLIYFFHNIALMIFAYAVSFNKNDKKHKAILKVFTLYYIEVIVIIFITGVLLKKLNLVSISIFCILLLSVGIYIIIKKQIILEIKNVEIKLSFLKTFDKFILLLLLVILITMLYKLFNVFLFIPYTWDSTAYHLPNLVDYIQSGKIYVSPKLIWSNIYPRNIEMLNLWELIHFRNGITLSLPQYTITIIGSIGVYGILRNEEIKVQYSILGAITFLSTPIVLAQMSTNYIDTSLGSIFILCIYFFNIYIREKSFSSLCFVGLSLGLLLGIKYSSLGYVAVFIFSLFAVRLYQERKLSIVIKQLIIVGIICFGVAGGWYILNMDNFGNPIYPFKLSFLGKEIFSGMDMNASIMTGNTPVAMRYKNSILKIVTSWFQVGSGWYLSDVPTRQLTLKEVFENIFYCAYDQRIGGFGFTWIFILLPSIFMLLLEKIKNKKANLAEIAILVIPTICFIITPANWWTRYVCYFLIVGIYSFIKLLNSHMEKNAFVILYLVIFMVLGCIQGSLYEFNRWKVYTKALIKNETKNVRAISFQVRNPEYTAFFDEINGNGKANNILLINCKLDYLYYLQGDKTQNTVSLYPYETKNHIKDLNVDKYEDFVEIIDKNNSDYIIIEPRYKKFMTDYIASGNYKYELHLSASDSIIYKKIF